MGVTGTERSVFNAKKDDRRPFLKGQLLDDNGDPVDISGSTITFSMRDRTATPTLKVTAAAVVITSGPLAQFEYRWAAGDLDTVGEFDGEFNIVFSDTTPLTLPSEEPITVRVRENVAA